MKRWVVVRRSRRKNMWRYSAFIPHLQFLSVRTWMEQNLVSIIFMLFRKNKLKSTVNRVTRRSTDNRVTRSTDKRVTRSTDKRETRSTDNRETRSTDNRETWLTEGLGVRSCSIDGLQWCHLCLFCWQAKNPSANLKLS